MAAPLDDAALDTLFRTARTYNGYTGDPVTQADIRAIYELAKMGPTSANMQPARFVWLLSQEGKDRLAQFASSKNAVKIKAAPAAVIIAHDLDFHEQLPWLFPHEQSAKTWFGDIDGRTPHAFRNATLQGAYLLMAARALGFDTGPMSGFDNAKVDAAFFADTSWRSNFLCSIGHGDPAKVQQRLLRLSFEEACRIV